MKHLYLPLHFHISPEGLAAFSRLQEAVWIFNIDKKRIEWANDAALRIWDSETLDELILRDFATEMSPSVAQRLTQNQEDFINSNAVLSETWTIYPKGKPVTLQMRLSGVVLKNKAMAMLCEGRESNATDSNADPDFLRCSEALLHTKVMITLFSSDGHALYRNPAARAAVKNTSDLLSTHFVDKGVFNMLASQLKLTGEHQVIAAVNTKFGIRWHDISARSCYDAVTGGASVLVTESDVTELQRVKERAMHLATRDVVTGLFNRRYLMENFPVFIKRVDEKKLEAALLLIDIDHFTYVNESIGYESGEHVLVGVADRLRTCVGHEERLARIGGDSFLIEAISGDIVSRVRKLTGQIQEAFSAPFTIGNRMIPITLSMGVACYPKDGTDATTLMKHGDLALSHAKNNGRNRVSFFEPSFKTVSRTELFHDGALLTALKNREFTIYLQPRVELSSGKIVGAEALARWNSPRYGIVSPLLFISACEELGLISELGAQIFEMAAIEQKRYLQEGRELKISVNLSPHQLKDQSLIPTIEKIVHRTGCSTNLLTFEITESAMPENNETTLSALHAIQDMGFQFAIDDFGTGYSNLAHIQKYPFSELKIDRAFVNVPESQRKLADMIVLMAQALGYLTVAEGIETLEQMEWLRQRGVNEYQGFFFSKPLPLDDFYTLLKNKDAEIKWENAQENAMASNIMTSSIVGRA